jgi:hypothetical protein
MMISAKRLSFYYQTGGFEEYLFNMEEGFLIYFSFTSLQTSHGKSCFLQLLMTLVIIIHISKGEVE